MKYFSKTIGLIIALAASSAQAIPTMLFDGDIAYDATSEELSVSAALIGTLDITPAPTIINSTLVFSAFFDSVESIVTQNCHPFFGCSTTTSTKGNFSSSTNAGTDDLEIFDGNGTLLLSANFSSLSLEGNNNSDNGRLDGILTATDGSLMSTFEGSDLFAFQLDLSQPDFSAFVFSDTMYDSNFIGHVDGHIQASVPEPTPLALLSLGILIAGFARKKQNK